MSAGTRTILLATCRNIGEMAIATLTTTTQDVIGMAVTAVQQLYLRDLSLHLSAQMSIANDGVVVHVCMHVFFCMTNVNAMHFVFAVSM